MFKKWLKEWRFICLVLSWLASTMWIGGVVGYYTRLYLGTGGRNGIIYGIALGAAVTIWLMVYWRYK